MQRLVANDLVPYDLYKTLLMLFAACHLNGYIFAVFKVISERKPPLCVGNDQSF